MPRTVSEPANGRIPATAHVTADVTTKKMRPACWPRLLLSITPPASPQPPQTLPRTPPSQSACNFVHIECRTSVPKTRINHHPHTRPIPPTPHLTSSRRHAAPAPNDLRASFWGPAADAHTGESRESEAWGWAARVFWSVIKPRPHFCLDPQNCFVIDRMHQALPNVPF